MKNVSLLTVTYKKSSYDCHDGNESCGDFNKIWLAFIPEQGHLQAQYFLNDVPHAR